MINYLNEFSLNNKTAFVVGGLGLIGKEVSTAYAQAGANTIVLDIKDEDYGGRGYTCKDIEGHLWNFGTYDPWG